MNEIERALQTLRNVMIEDPAYAWGWHSNIAMCADDAFAQNENNFEARNDAARRFMRILFQLECESHDTVINYGEVNEQSKGLKIQNCSAIEGQCLNTNSLPKPQTVMETFTDKSGRIL